MKCQILFSKKNLSNVSSGESAHKVVNGKNKNF